MIELAASLVANFLLPYVKEGLAAVAEKVTASAGEAVGEEAVSVTKRVWERVRKLFGDHPEEEGALRSFQADDRDETTVKYFEKRLAALLEANPGAARELTELLSTPAPGGDQSISAVMGNTVTVTITESTLDHSPTSINVGNSAGAGGR